MQIPKPSYETQIWHSCLVKTVLLHGHTGLSIDAINAYALQGFDGGFTTRRTAKMSEIGAK